MAGQVKELNDSTFAPTVSAGVTLVDFWAPWCGPCRMQGPVVEELAGKYEGKAVVAKVNVDEVADAPAKFNVSSIPTLVVLKDGKEVKRFVGVSSASELGAAMDAVL
jgi:thioredoxin 1